MSERQSAVIQRLSKRRSTTVCFSRFFNNERVKVKDLIQCSKDHCSQCSEGQDVLVLQDTTEYNYWHHRGQIKENTLGRLSHQIGLGYFAHCALAINAQDDFPLGYSHMQMWVRPIDGPDKQQRQYLKLPIEEKESYRWITTIEESQKVLQKARSLTFIADRECDIYELWERCSATPNTNLIIRSRGERKLEDSTSLYSHIAGLPVTSRMDIEVQENKKKKRSKHQATLEIKWSKIKIKAPNNKKGAPVELCAVEARESNQTVKGNESPVHWMLLTTRQITDAEKAAAVIADYCKRWSIEILFSVTKTRGVNVEESQLAQGQALMKLGMMAFQTALQILQLKHQREGKGKQEYSLRIVFDQQQEALMEKLIRQWEGKTEKQKNPYKKGTLARASWLIARMGGWNGYKSESPPGVKTFSMGMKRFEDMFTAYLILKKDVCID